MLRPTKSLGLYLQMAGRASRPAPGKGRAILLDHAGNSTEHGVYDFPHAWSLEGSLETTALVCRCPQCGAVLEIRVVEYPECDHQFVRPMAAPAPRVPVTRPGQLERLDDGLMRRLRVITRGGTLDYGRLLRWVGSDTQRAEMTRRANGYHRGWVRHVLETAA